MPAGPITGRPAPQVRGFRPEDRAWVAALHQDHYRSVEAFDEGFDRAVDAALSDLLTRCAPDRSRGFVLDAGGEPKGCLFLYEQSPEQARIRLFLFAADLRGRGFGRRMLAHATAEAQVLGFTALLVSTFDRHAAACALYHAAGFREIRQAPVRAFGHDLLQRDFRLDLAAP
jgi:GNAT superfamily N-acetyltransferase